MDIANKYLVSLGPKNQIVMLNPPRGPLSPEDALLLAAWLVSIAEGWTEIEFKDVLQEVLNS